MSSSTSQSRPKRNVALAAGVGAGAGNMLHFAVFGPKGMLTWSRSEWIWWIVSTAITFSLAYLYSHRSPNQRQSSVPFFQWTIRGSIAALISALILKLVLGLGTSGPRYYTFVVGFASFLSAAVVTYCWTLGVARHPSRAGLYGALSGMAAGFIIALILILEAIFVAHVRAEVLLRFAIVAMLEWGLLGLAGGITIDRGWGPAPSWSVAASLAVAAVTLIPLTSRLFGLRVDIDYALSELLPPLGWGTALLSVRSSNHVLRAPQRPRPGTPARV